MAGTLRRTREWRVHLANKWSYLDNLTAETIADKFEDEYDIDITPRTVYNYLSEEEAEAVEDRINKEHANTRLQIADREERLYQRAREAEANATVEAPIKRVFPRVEQRRVDRDPMAHPTWEFISPDHPEWPEWATPGRDAPIVFTDDTTRVQPGEKYPVEGIDGEPKYTTELVGVETVPNEKARAFRRGEQSDHLEAKGEILNLYEENVNLQADVEQSMDDEQQAELLDAIDALQD
jgi:hypothetical protein